MIEKTPPALYLQCELSCSDVKPRRYYSFLTEWVDRICER